MKPPELSQGVLCICSWRVRFFGQDDLFSQLYQADRLKHIDANRVDDRLAIFVDGHQNHAFVVFAFFEDVLQGLLQLLLHIFFSAPDHLKDILDTAHVGRLPPSSFQFSHPPVKACTYYTITGKDGWRFFTRWTGKPVVGGCLIMLAESSQLDCDSNFLFERLLKFARYQSRFARTDWDAVHCYDRYDFFGRTGDEDFVCGTEVF